MSTFNRRASVLVAIGAVLGVFLLLAAPALAATQKRVAKLQYNSKIRITGPVLDVWRSTVVAEDTISVGTPSSLVVPAGVFTGGYSFTYGSATLALFGFNPPFLYWNVSVTISNTAATLKGGHANAPADTLKHSYFALKNTPSSVAVNGTPPTTSTSICMSSVTGGAGAAPNGCFGRIGTLSVKAGASKFGGTIRMYFTGPETSITTTTGGGSNTNSRYGATPPFAHGALDVSATLGPNLFGSYGTYVRLPLTTPVTYTSSGQVSELPWTTGTVTGRNSFRGTGTVTTYDETGTNALNFTAATGMLSVIQPATTSIFERKGTTITNVNGRAFMRRMQITLLPEPAQLAMLGCGILSMAGLFRLRRR